MENGRVACERLCLRCGGDWAKKEIYDVKQQRLHLAQDEFDHLNNALNTLNVSRSSLCSSTSSLSTKYDPDLLKSEVAHARDRVSRLKCELEQIRTEMTCAQRGVETLTLVEQKLGGSASGLNSGGCYNISEAQAIMTELREIQRSLSSGEKERMELMQSLAKLKDDLTRLQLCNESSPDASTLSIPPVSNTASQTDLSGELMPMGNRLAELARMRLEYDAARKKIQNIQQQLADLEEKVTPGQAESDRDRLLLFQEKEQLLRELRSQRGSRQIASVQEEIKRLEQDLNDAIEISNQAIADRLKLHEEKQLLLQQLRDGLKTMTQLESQLRMLSASTLSMSSSSSLGSLSTTSSKGSLSSGLSFTDIYGGPQCISTTQDKPVDMDDLHRRVERLLRGETPSISREYSPVSSGSLAGLLYSSSNMSQGSGLGRPTTPPVSPLSEKMPPLPTPPSTRSVSAAVSDESVAGDSGVFEASNKSHNTVPDVHSDTAQIQIKLRYSISDHLLHVGIEKARNLTALNVPEGTQVYIKASLLPNDGNAALNCCTKPITDLTRPRFGENFPLPVPLNKLRTKTLQVNVWNIVHDQSRECLACAQVSLADYNPEVASLKWYNLLNFKFLQPSSTKSNPSGSTATSSALVHNNKEESSDDSTIISSQTSTLTRNQECEHNTLGPINDQLNEFNNSDDDDYNEDTDVEEEREDEESDEDLDVFYCADDEPLEQVLEISDEECLETEDKETNTECVFVPEKKVSPSKRQESKEMPSIIIKRSQTFSPVAKSQYICRLNRSDSDSAMPLYRRSSSTAMPFKRNSVERRSLRWSRPLGQGSLKHHRNSFVQAVPRTSIDLELDLQAQHTRLQSLRDEISRLKSLKTRLETAKEKGDAEIAAWVLEDAQFQNLVSQADSKSEEEKKIDKLLKKTSREIYKLRKSKAGSGKPDVISFKEKMAFFTRPNISVPILPPMENASEIESSSATDSAAVSSEASDSQRYEFPVETYGVQV
ncbi:hypothetical protein V9T40_006109 [Parthenolecanium corni]|uniref:C2 domain-containing protein n=1 Tax=Parthenolecanium corni TaxID=536013 RepID=A0AAN9Y989_9HEMI